MAEQPPKFGVVWVKIAEFAEGIGIPIDSIAGNVKVVGPDEPGDAPTAPPVYGGGRVGETGPAGQPEGAMVGNRMSAEGDQFVQAGFEGAALSDAEGDFVQGSVANDEPAAAKPVPIGGRANAAVRPAVGEDDVTEARFDLLGNLHVVPRTAGATRDGFTGTLGGFPGNNSDTVRALAVSGVLFGPDGAYDSPRSAGDASPSIGVALVSPTGHSHNNVTADEQILGAAGKLHTITVNTVSTVGVLTIYDSLTEAGTVIATLDLALVEAAAGSPYTLHFDVACLTGLFLGFDAALVGNFTVATAI